MNANIRAAFDSELTDADARHLAEKHQLQAEAAAASRQYEASAGRIAELEAQLRTAEECALALVIGRTEAAVQLRDLRAGREQVEMRSIYW